MRTVTLSDGSTIEVRGLSRKERIKARAMGFGPIFFDYNTGDVNAACEYAFAINGLDISKLPEADDRAEAKVFKAIIFDTYGLEEEEKNLSRSGDPSRTSSD